MDCITKDLPRKCILRGDTIELPMYVDADVPIDTTGSVSWKIRDAAGTTLLEKTTPVLFDETDQPYWITELTHEESLALPVGDHRWGFVVKQSVDAMAAVKNFRGAFEVGFAPAEG
jgi:hypothetical protein